MENYNAHSLNIWHVAKPSGIVTIIKMKHISFKFHELKDFILAYIIPP
jgi:hypothetical protein